VRALFARSDVRVFPPPGPNRGTSFFAETLPAVQTKLGHPRTYVGVAAPGRSMKVLLLRSYVALLGAAQAAYARDPASADPYMTLVGYFNSLRELGGSRRIVEDEVQTRLRAYGTRLRVGERKGSLASRTIRADVVELTSRVTTSDVAKAKRRLGLQHRDPDHIDIALATNMISVGLDITRLGLMVVMRAAQVATAEYIQTTSRVGRDEDRPGLVVTLLNMHKPRDRSHYERFESLSRGVLPRGGGDERHAVLRRVRSIAPSRGSPWPSRATCSRCSHPHKAPHAYGMLPTRRRNASPRFSMRV
jgi:hypothetical protein